MDDPAPPPPAAAAPPVIEPATELVPVKLADKEDDFDDSNPPLLFVDVNLGQNEQ